MPLVPLCTSPSSCSPLDKPSSDASLEPVISLLTVPPSWPGDGVTQMPPMDTLLLTIPFLFYEAFACTPSSVVALAYLSCFCSLLPTHTMLLLHNACWHGLCACIRSILGSFVWTQPIGACA